MPDKKYETKLEAKMINGMRVYKHREMMEELKKFGLHQKWAEGGSCVTAMIDDEGEVWMYDYDYEDFLAGREIFD